MKVIRPETYEEKGNDLKDVVQRQGVVEYMKDPLQRKMLVEAFVGFGKTRMGMAIMEEMAIAGELLPFDEVIVVCPAQLINMWRAVCYQTLTIAGIKYDVMTPNAYTVTDKTKVWKPKLLIVDEGHKILNALSEFFSTALDRTISDNILVLSGSIKEEHKKFLQSRGFHKHFHVTKLWGFKNSLVPEYTVVCIPVTLTPTEQSEYLHINNYTEKLRKKLMQGGIFDVYMKHDDPKIKSASLELGLETGQIIGLMKKWRSAYTERGQLLYNAKNKKAILLKYLAEINEQVFVYAMSKNFVDEVVEQCPLAVGLHSGHGKKHNRQALESFETELNLYLISIGKIKEGVNVPKCRFAVRVAFTSNESDTEQIGGRILRLDDENPDKEAFLFYLYIDDIDAYESTIPSQDKVWLQRNLTNEHNVKYLKNSLEGLDFIKSLAK